MKGLRPARPTRANSPAGQPEGTDLIDEGITTSPSALREADGVLK